jgi:hypothetical protein
MACDGVLNFRIQWFSKSKGMISKRFEKIPVVQHGLAWFDMVSKFKHV